MEWFATSASRLIFIFCSTIGIYLAVMVFTRLNGLRSFSKMSSFDFAITIAIGSVVAGTVLSETPSIAEGAVALGSLFLCQRVVSWARTNHAASRVVDNTPVVLMVGETMFEDVLRTTRVTVDDVYGKLREANVLDFDEVQAVVLEATGDISVLHGDPQHKRLNPKLLHGVRGQDRLSAGE